MCVRVRIYANQVHERVWRPRVRNGRRLPLCAPVHVCVCVCVCVHMHDICICNAPAVGHRDDDDDEWASMLRHRHNQAR